MIDDSALPQLQALLDTEAMSARVGVRIDEAVLVRHKPGRRALVRYECADGALLAKLRVGHRAIRPFRLMRSFEAAGFTAPAAIRVAEPVICLPELSTWVQRVDSGTPGEVAAFEHPHCVGLAAAARLLATAARRSRMGLRLGR